MVVVVVASIEWNHTEVDQQECYYSLPDTLPLTQHYHSVSATASGVSDIKPQPPALF